MSRKKKARRLLGQLQEFLPELPLQFDYSICRRAGPMLQGMTLFPSPSAPGAYKLNVGLGVLGAPLDVRQALPYNNWVPPRNASGQGYVFDGLPRPAIQDACAGIRTSLAPRLDRELTAREFVAQYSWLWKAPDGPSTIHITGVLLVLAWARERDEFLRWLPVYAEQAAGRAHAPFPAEPKRLELVNVLADGVRREHSLGDMIDARARAALAELDLGEE